MSYSMLVLGELAVPPAAMDRYRAVVVDPALRDDWLGNLSVHTTSKPRSVEALLAWLPKSVSKRAHSWLTFRVDAGAGRIELRGILAEDDFYDRGVEIVELFRAAGELGGRGELWFLEEQVMMFGEQQPDTCFVVKASPKGTTILHPSKAEQRRAMGTAGFQEVVETFAASLDEVTREHMGLRLAPGKTKAPPASRKTPSRPKKRQ